jgi:hypothetical protein
MQLRISNPSARTHCPSAHRTTRALLLLQVVLLPGQDADQHAH